jgi:hypothetical protein
MRRKFRDASGEKINMSDATQRANAMRKGYWVTGKSDPEWVPGKKKSAQKRAAEIASELRKGSLDNLKK